MRLPTLAFTSVLLFPFAALAGDGPAATQPHFTGIPGTVIVHLPAARRVYVGSPSLAVLPSGAYVASHDTFGPAAAPRATFLFSSTDRGKTWAPLATVDGQYWSTLFLHRGNLYIMGTSGEYGHVVVRRSTDGGKTWTTPRDGQSGLLRAEGRFHTAPVPLVEHEGRLYRAVEDAMGPGGWGAHFRAIMMSAPVDADLLQAASWTATAPVARDPAWLSGRFNGFLEGNAVVAPDGRIVNLLRVDDGLPGERAALLRLDGDRLSFDPARDFVTFPGGAKKFTVRFDPVSRRYWSLANSIQGRSTGPAGDMRNTLALTSSADLREWTINCLLLHHPERATHAFQYADWQFDGDDLIAVIRTAHADGLGGAPRGHDANFLTFHRFQNYRTLSLKDSAPVQQVAPITLDAGPVTIIGHDIEFATLENGAKAFSNREYVFENVPFSLAGQRFTRTAGGQLAEIRVRALRDTTLTAITATGQNGVDLTGWTPEAPFPTALRYTDRAGTPMTLYRRPLRAGEELTLPQGNWSGLLLIVPAKVP